jgi:hypothetical protein
MECVMDYYIRHKSTWTEIEGVLKLLNRVAKQEIIPSTKYSFFKHFKKDFDFSFHVFCKTESCSSIEMIKCGSGKIEYVCPQCSTKNPVRDVKVAFVTFEIEKQLKNLLESHIDSLILPSEPLESFPIKDVWNCEIHRKILQELQAPFISITLNTDGVQIYESNKTSMWPKMICVNNLPLKERFKQDNLIISGFHYSNKLEMDIYLESFVQEIDRINSRGGIELSIGTFKVFCDLSSLDTPAKSKVQNMVQYNGYSGCPYCWARGDYIDRMVRFSMRYLLYFFWFKKKKITHILYYKMALESLIAVRKCAHVM